MSHSVRGDVTYPFVGYQVAGVCRADNGFDFVSKTRPSLCRFVGGCLIVGGILGTALKGGEYRTDCRSWCELSYTSVSSYLMPYIVVRIYIFIDLINREISSSVRRNVPLFGEEITTSI